MGFLLKARCCAWFIHDRKVERFGVESENENSNVQVPLGSIYRNIFSVAELLWISSDRCSVNSYLTAEERELAVACENSVHSSQST